ncbi:hypothetical protein PLANTIT3_90137 [Plantibacter sp. T3]|nr:hypothetical protein PLANTIT3_90137 [Plantibacter sp. T3]
MAVGRRACDRVDRPGGSRDRSRDPSGLDRGRARPRGRTPPPVAGRRHEPRLTRRRPQARLLRDRPTAVGSTGGRRVAGALRRRLRRARLPSLRSPSARRNPPAATHRPTPEKGTDRKQTPRPASRPEPDGGTAALSQESLGAAQPTSPDTPADS